MGDVETVACAICGSTDYEERHYPIRSGYLVRCSKCDLYYANPRRSDIIQDIQDSNTPETLYEAYRLNYRGRILAFNKYLEKIQRFKQPPGRILDVGCYEGFFLNEARKQGWEARGVEPNVGGAKFAAEELKLDVKQSTLEKASLPDNFFDVVTLLATLEHMPNPFEVLQEAKRIIKDDGLLVVSVPTVPFYLKLLRSKWRMFIGDHYYFFNDNSVSRFMAKLDFTVVGKFYDAKSVDLDTISARLSEDWQPHNLGRAGKLIRKVIMGAGMGSVRFPINLFDAKIYFARPNS